MSVENTDVELGSKEFWQEMMDNPAALAAKVCKIDITNLQEVQRQHPALRAWINSAFETARIAEARADLELTKVKARVFLRAKQKDDPDTGKSKTVDTLRNEVDDNPEVHAAMENLLSRQQVKGALRAMADALEDRKDMIIQISAKLRQEEAHR